MTDRRSLKLEIESRIAQFNPMVLDDSRSLTQAAVALVVIHEHAQPNLIVTRRAPKLKSHSGQWALPGGRLDAGETTVDAARREVEEEIGLALSADNTLGQLDPYCTRSGYLITPIVFWSDARPTDLQPSPDEVESIHMFSFEELKRRDSPNLEQIPQSDRDVLSMNYLDDVIYAPTAAMLYQFREVCLLGKDTRVSHFDQPVFAWK